MQQRHNQHQCQAKLATNQPQPLAALLGNLRLQRAIAKLGQCFAQQLGLPVNRQVVGGALAITPAGFVVVIKQLAGVGQHGQAGQTAVLKLGVQQGCGAVWGQIPQRRLQAGFQLALELLDFLGKCLLLLAGAALDVPGGPQQRGGRHANGQYQQEQAGQFALNPHGSVLS